MAELIKFFIEPLQHASSDRQTWLIFRGSMSHCVGVHDSAKDAIAATIPMAEYCAAAGQTAQIFIRDRMNAPWRAVEA